MNVSYAKEGPPLEGARMLPQAPTGLMGFFRYHGVWAPGVRLFRAIGFRTKAVVISAAFALPIANLSWSYFNDKATAIGFSAKERLGVDYAKALFEVFDDLQAQRLGRAPGAARMKRLDDANRAHGEALTTTSAFAELHKHDAELRSGNLRADALDAQIARTIDLLGASTDGSNLTLDPDIDTYYLMDAAMFRLVPMAESVAQLGQLGHAALAAGSLPLDQRRALIERAAELKVNAAAVKAGLAKAVTYNADVGKAVPAATALAAIDELLARTERQLLGAQLQGDAPGYAAVAAAAREATVKLRTQATDELDRLIAVRVAGLEQQREITLAVLALALLVVVYLFMSFRKVLDGGLREVALHINAMRDGDLTTRPRPWGRDEAAKLMQTITEMQASLRNIVSEVRHAADGMVQASNEISAGSSDLSARTERSAANLEQSASAMEQVAANAQQTAHSASQAAGIAGENARTAEQGGQVMASMVQTMQGIQDSSRKISDIIGTIDGIAFQTNILALNAAVEAARAGESGRGFAVVASEVRQLAQRSAAAAKEIKNLITTSAQQVEAGSSVVSDAGETISRIVTEASRVNQLLAEIANGAQEQAAGVRQSTEAVQHIDEATQQNAALVEQTAAAAQSLRDQALRLSERVSAFKLPA